MEVPAAWLQQVLLLGVLPMWMAAGLGDALCHRAQRMEYSSGWRETLLHLLMIAEVAAGITAALLLTINAAVLTLLVGLCALHELTTGWDLRYSSATRAIPPVEQWVHAWQTVLPWVALGLIFLIHHDAWQSGPNGRVLDWTWRLKDPPLQPLVIASVLGAGAVTVLLPFLIEWHRCRTAAVRTADPSAD